MFSQLFVFLNFFILIGILVYIWLNYGISYIQSEQKLIDQEDIKRNELYNSIMYQQEFIEKQVIAKMIRREKLLIAMHQWAENIKNEKKQKDTSLDVLSTSFCNLIRDQYIQIKKHCFQKRVIYPAVIKVEQELTELYQNNQPIARQFVETICKQIQEEVK